MRKRLIAWLLTAALALALLPAGPLTGAALAAEGPDYTSVEVTEDSFERVCDLAYRLCDENQQLGRNGGFTWDSEGKQRSWTYYNGIMMDAFLMLSNEAFEPYVNTFYRNNVTSQGMVNSSGAADNYYRGNELDSIPPTRALFDLLRSDLVDEAEKSKYKKMIDYVYFVMSDYAVIPDTAGNFRHKMNNPNWETYQLALDGMYMAQPFFMELANALDDGILTLEDFTFHTGSNENLEDTDKIYSAVFDRMYWVGNSLYDDGTELYNHAWGPDAGPTGQYWLRAVGWYAAALADVISMLPDNFAEERDMLIEIETRLFDGMIAHQDRETVMWYNVIDYGPELSGPVSMNELESSGTALMAYAMMRSYAEGFVGRSYGAAGLRAFNAIAALKLDEEGLHDVYLSSGVETYPEGYLSKPYVTNEAKGVGPLFMAAAWARQAADLYNQPVAVPLCAVDGDTDEALPGVTAQVLDGDGALVAEWSSTTEPLPVDGILPGAEYTIHVTEVPTGYELPEDAVFFLDDETIILNGAPIGDGVINLLLSKNHYSIVTEIIPEGCGTVTAEPADPAADELVTLTVEPASGCVLKSLTVTDEAGNEIFLDDGQFYMPEGDVTVTAEFEKTRLLVQPVDSENDMPLAGVELQLLDDGGAIVEAWQSGDGPHLLEGLPVEREYTLRVSAVPEGYIPSYAEPVFYFEADGAVMSGGDEILPEDNGDVILPIRIDRTWLEITTIDNASGAPVAGAILQVLDDEEAVVEEWPSGEEPHVIKGLAIGREYVLHMIEPAEGYLPAEDDIIVLDDNGNLSMNVGITKAEAELELDLTADPASAVNAGDEITFTATVRNAGDVALEDVVVVSPVADFSSDVFALAPGEEIPVMFTYVVTEDDVYAGEIACTATVTGTAVRGQDPAAAEAQVSVTTVDVCTAFGHEWGEWTEVIPPTETEPGVESRSCANCGETETRSVDLYPDDPIVITQQPEDVAVPLGEIARTTVVAEGEGLKYQWYGREANGSEFKSGLKGDTYSVALVKSKIGRVVWCVITDKDGNTVTTREALLNVVLPEDYEYPAITADAADCFVDVGETASVTIAATGYGELNYQWYILNQDAESWARSGLTGDTYSVAMNGSRDGRQIYCVVTDAYGNTARTSTVTIGYDYPEGYTAPVITDEPESVIVGVGEIASVTMAAEGEELSYQWYLRNPGSASFARSSLHGDTYSVKMVPGKSGREVYCVVTDKYGNKAQTQTVTLSMDIPEGYTGPQIVTQPADAFAAKGELASATVAAEGEGLSYQWYGRDPGQESFWKSSLKTDTYSVKMVAGKSGRQVYCVITDKYGLRVTSETVTLTMEP